MADRTVRIGGFSAFWGDTPTAAEQLVRRGGRIDYLIGDYLAEITMVILARAKKAGGKGGAGEGGFVAEFVKTVWVPLMKEIMEKKIKIVTNAGGLSPVALKEAIEKAAKDAGITVPVVAAVAGDDLSGTIGDIRSAGRLRTFAAVAGEDEALWEEGRTLMSCNAYLGAFPIAAALSSGAQIVVTGRCVDSALVLGPLIHEFGWGPSDYDVLSGGSLAGHIIECGAQCTGGNFTDWRLSAWKGWDDVGFPIAECRADGSCIITKPEGTGGVVTVGSVGEQIVYEIGDPAAYILPDVVCDWRHVTLEEVGAPTPGGHGGSDRVLVRGARGTPPTAYYKIGATSMDGLRLSVELLIPGHEAAAKAQAVGEAILKKASRLCAQRKLGPYTETRIELIGAEEVYGEHSAVRRLAREVVLRIGVAHTNPKALELFGREIPAAATGMAPGICGAGSGRSKPAPAIKYYSCLVERNAVPITLVVGPNSAPFAEPARGPARAAAAPPAAREEAAETKSEEMVTVPLQALCFARSGDKGDVSNIGVIARKKCYVPFLRQILTEKAVGGYMSHFARGSVTRFEMPGLGAFNFMLTKALGGGGVTSLYQDRQGKTYAQVLLSMPVSVPRAWVRDTVFPVVPVRARL